jgi:hypothetical protein
LGQPDLEIDAFPHVPAQFRERGVAVGHGIKNGGGRAAPVLQSRFRELVDSRERPRPNPGSGEGRASLPESGGASRKSPYFSKEMTTMPPRPRRMRKLTVSPESTAS